MFNPFRKKVPFVAAAAVVVGAALSPVVTSAPAQAAGPVYTAGFWFTKSECDAARVKKAADRSFRVSSCKAGYDSWSIPGYYFTYQSAY